MLVDFQSSPSYCIKRSDIQIELCLDSLNVVLFLLQLKFFRCNPTHFFGDYDDELGHHRIGDDSDEDDDDDDFDDDRKK